MSFNKSVLMWGLSGLIGISVVFYFVQTLGMQDWLGPWYFFKTRWYFVLPLVFGFAVQMGFFRAIHLKNKHHGGGAMAASGGVSTASMVACCLHNLAPLIPIVGFSGVAVFFSTYQDYVFSISILFVIFGIIYMWRKYKNMHQCCKNKQSN